MTEHKINSTSNPIVLRGRSLRIDSGGRGVNVQPSPSYGIGFGRSLTG
jgi:hypothetical protein